VRRQRPSAIQETKLIPPSRPGGLIERKRLLAGALPAMEGRLLLVVGAAGFGKSSLLASLHRELSRRECVVGWVSLDEADNDHARFLSHFVEAFRQHDPRFGAVVSTLLGSGAPLPASTLRTGLLNELSALNREIFVFLDDYHLIQDAEVRKTVSDILLAPLSGVHLAIGTRSSNGLPLSRLRTLGQLREINGADLAFSEDETRDFLAIACTRRLESRHVSALHCRTEGWAASLQLASIALDGVADVCHFLKGFSGETRDVGDFLSDEVLRRQKPELQKFLLETSILQRFNTELCGCISGRTDARELIDEIESKNLFVYSLDDQRNWYRYHHLFADFLRRRLRDRDPDAVPGLHRRASEWLIANGLSSEATEHAFLAGDVDLAGRLLDEACVDLFATGQINTLQQQAARLPDGALGRLPRLQLELSWDYEIQWRFDDARAALDNVERQLQAESSAAEVLSPCSRALLESKLVHRQMMLALFQDQRDAATILCDRWLKEKPADDAFMQASVGAAMMLIERERYDCEAAPAKADSLRARFLAGGAIYGTIFHDSVAAVTLFMRGELDLAQATLERARQCATELAGAQASATAMPTALLAELCYERGELSRARDLLAEHASFSAEFGFIDNAIARFVTASRLAFAAGDTDDAEAALEAGLFVAHRSEFPRLLAHLAAECMRQLASLGRTREAAAFLERPEIAPRVASPLPGEHPTTTDELFTLCWARGALLRGESKRVIQVLRRWIAHTQQARCHRATLRLSAVLARAYALASDPNAARRTVREALSLAPRAGFVRTFVDEGPMMAAILEDLRVSLPDSEFGLRQIVANILDRTLGSRVHRTAGPTDAGHCGESLSQRELEMLRLSAQGMATSDICRATHLSENTVKWYWQRIFTKLGVHRRFDAVKAARQRRWMD
jgi:LuxR family maltose regulon positive regulatory protein